MIKIPGSDKNSVANAGANAAILQGQKRGNYEVVEILRAYTLVVGGPTYISTQIPVNNPVVAAIIRVNISLTIGSGSGAISEGELLFTKALSFRSDKNEYFLKNVSGRGLYKMNQFEFGSAMQKNAIAASTGVYSVVYVIPFCDFSMKYPYDTIFDPEGRGYKSVELAVTSGGVADLLGTVGTSSVTATLDLEFVQLKEVVVPGGLKPRYAREIGNIAPVSLAAQTFLDIERSPDLSYTAFLLGTHDSSVAACTIGVPFSGTPLNSILTDISLETNNSYPVKSLQWTLLNFINKLRIAEAAAPVGIVYIDMLGYGLLAQDGSYQGGLYSAKYGKLRFTSNVAAIGTTPTQLSCTYDSVRDLKP